MNELLERAEALQSLQQQLKAARTRGRVALVSGEAGIGKSSLLHTLADTHAPVWWGRCDALSTPHPLAPLLDIARDVRPRFASCLSQARPALFDAVLDELRAADTPVLVVVEDAHWADDATVDWLKFLGRRIESTQALLVISYRDDELSWTHPLRRLLGELPSTALTRLCLPRLSERAVETLARQAGRTVEGVYAATQGNPFFVTELLREAGAMLPTRVPATVQDLVLARYARLAGAQQAVVRVTALVPTRIERWLLDALLEPEAADLEACLASGLLLAEGDFLQFRHELARVAIESSLQPPIARALHRQVLDTLVASTRPCPVARLAHHAVLAGDEEAVRRFAPAAAEEATARGSLREAARHWQAVLRCAPAEGHEASRLGWLEAQAQACQQLACLGDGLEARRQLDASFCRVGDVRSQALNLSLTAHLHLLSTQDAMAEAASRRAMALLDPLPAGAELATVQGVEATLRLLNRECEASLSWSHRAVAVARRFGDRERELGALATAAAAKMFFDHESGCAQADALLRTARDEGRPGIVATLLTNIGAAAVESMQLGPARRWLHEAIVCATEHEMDGALYYAQAWLSLCELRSGHWDEAADRASLVLERPGVWPISRATALVTLCSLRLRRGDPGAQPLLDESRALAAGSGALQRLAPMAALHAEAAWLRDDPAACQAEAGAALSLAQQRCHPWFIGELAAWCARAGSASPAPAGCARPHALALAGQWQAAAALWQQLGCPFEQAMALAQGNAAARQQALQLLDGLGARPAAETLRRRLRQAGVRGVSRGARESTRSHPCGLTAAEMRVLELMSQDLRNADIAARLHRSVRTVDHHVAAVLAKLQATTRYEAVRRAERESWLVAAAQSGQSGTAR